MKQKNYVIVTGLITSAILILITTQVVFQKQFPSNTEVENGSFSDSFPEDDEVFDASELSVAQDGNEIVISGFPEWVTHVQVFLAEGYMKYTQMVDFQEVECDSGYCQVSAQFDIEPSMTYQIWIRVRTSDGTVQPPENSFPATVTDSFISAAN